MKINGPTLDEVIKESDENLSSISPGEIIIGLLVDLDEQGRPLVNFPKNTSEQSIVALSTLAITKANVGRQVALLFSDGELEKPVIMGMIHAPLQSILENYVLLPQSSDDGLEQDETEKSIDVDDVLLDGNKLVFEAKEEIVLKCGESSITLTKSGKVLIRGKYLLNRSTGVNRILGGSVQVN